MTNSRIYRILIIIHLVVIVYVKNSYPIVRNRLLGGNRKMNTNVWFVLTYGSSQAPNDWIQNRPIHMQKLYYIKSGTGWYTARDGTKQKFIPERIYLFPYNYEYCFENCPDDPLDHIFFDFLSFPPLIADHPIIYRPSENDGLLELFSSFEKFYMTLPNRGTKHFKSSEVVNVERGSIEETRRIVLRFLSTMVDLLSYYIDLPFINDEMIDSTLDLIRNNYMKRLNVADMAAASGYEVNYFIKRFRSIMYQTPYAYLRSYRIMIAHQLISAGETLDSAAMKTGYSDAASLSHAIASLKIRRM